MNKHLILAVSLKGGIGKSVFSRAFVDNLRTNGTAVEAYDADGGVGGLLMKLGVRDADHRVAKQQDPALGVGYYDIRQDGSRNMLLDSIGTGAPIIFHDLAGGSLADIRRIVDGGEPGCSGFLDALEGEGYQLVLCHLLNNLSEATASVGTYLKEFGTRARHVAVKNRAFGRSDTDFPFWTGYVDGQGNERGGATRKQFLELGGVEIELPALPPSTFAKVDNMNAPYSVAVSSPELTITERSHINKFLKDFAVSVEGARAALGF